MTHVVISRGDWDRVMHGRKTVCRHREKTVWLSARRGVRPQKELTLLMP